MDSYDRHTCGLCDRVWDSDTDALLCRAGDLLKQLLDNSDLGVKMVTALRQETRQQLVDTDKQETEADPPPAAYVCAACGFRCHTETHFQAHAYSPSHLDAVAKAAAMR